MCNFDLKNYSLEHKNNLNKTENRVKKSCGVEYISLECIGLEHNNALLIILYKTPERGYLGFTMLLLVCGRGVCVYAVR